MEMMIQVENLIFGYGAKSIIKGLDVAITRGDFVGIIGPNGSGKSTFLKLLTGVLTPDGGEIYFNEKSLQKIKVRNLARQLAMVPQSTEILYDFTAYEIVAMGRYPHQGRWSKEGKTDREMIQQAMELTGTWQFRDQRVQGLSGGERQRVIIARALAQEPDVIFLDEPTSSLDINYQIEIFDLMKELHRQGKTVIVVSHDLNLASQYCESLLLLSEGRVFAYGTPDEVITVENIRQVYNTEVVISQKYTGRPYVTLVSRRRMTTIRKDRPRIHLVCGGGSALELLNWLIEEGYQVTGGVLNQGDSDWQALLQNGRAVVEEKPFSRIMPETYRELLEVMKQANLIIVTEVPFGTGNIANLEAALEMAQHGKHVYILEQQWFHERDFTGGEAEGIYQSLLVAGAKSVKSLEELIGILKNEEVKV